jgi:hypothetical protein
MRFSSIYGKKLGDLTYQEMMQFFMEHLFFKFMDHGRQGIANGANEAVANFIGHFEQKGVLTPITIGIDAKNELARDLTLRLVNSFITGGTSNWEAALTGTWVAIAQYKEPQ